MLLLLGCSSRKKFNFSETQKFNFSEKLNFLRRIDG